MTVRFAGNNPPDIIHLPTRNFLAFAAQGWLSPRDADLATTDVKSTYDGKVAMLRDGPWVASALKKAPETTRAQLKVAMMPFARVPGGTSNSLHIPAKIEAEKRKYVWEFIRMTTTPEWQAKFTLLTSSPAPRRNALSAAELNARPELALVNRAAAESVNLFPESVTIRENYNEFAKIFVESGLKLITSDRPTADIMRELQAEMNKRVPAK